METARVDLVLCHSVFTHLPEDVQFAWLDELARILVPGGILIASTHGVKPASEYQSMLLSMNLNEYAQLFSTQLRDRGFFHALGKTGFETALPDYYGSAFHDIRYIAEKWQKDFRILAWLPMFALDHQDVIVMTRKV
jgi:hypothetical protein